MTKNKTPMMAIDSDAPGGQVIEEAVRQLRADGLVAIPTETVYGLAGRAHSPAAVKRIFEAKGRPATNPLILHVATVEQARRLASTWPKAADRLADRFWPGPLTLVVKRSEEVNDAVCAGLDTVAIRLPAHPVAQAIIAELGEPVAAPSANRYTEVSPTTADHVRRGLDGRLDLIVDGGATPVGVESTLVSVVDGGAEVLRPGMISRQTIGETLGVALVSPPSKPVFDDAEPRPSPGLSKRHYSPSAPLQLVDSEAFKRLHEQPPRGRTFVGWSGLNESPAKDFIDMPDDPVGYARKLYAVLHRLDQASVTEIVVELPPADDRWEAIRDRLQRAAS